MFVESLHKSTLFLIKTHRVRGPFLRKGESLETVKFLNLENPHVCWS